MPVSTRLVSEAKSEVPLPLRRIKTCTPTDRPADANEIPRVIVRRAKAIDPWKTICRHGFRSTGIACNFKNGGTIENPSSLLQNHES